MAYSTYTTEAIVCGGRDRNTFDRSLLLFTRSGGMLYAEARAVRREHSKQRCAVQDFTRVRVSLIRGKSGWRVGSIEALENFYSQAGDKDARGSVIRIVKMVRRFTRGEEAHAEVYDYVAKALTLLATPVTNRSFFEALAQVHFLGLLGYVAVEALPPELRAYDLQAGATEVRPEYAAILERHINSGVEHSHL